MTNTSNNNLEREIFGKSLNLSKIIKYQEGSVVSRTLVNKKSGTVTLFAFEIGQSLSEHTAPFDALIYILEGEAEVTISDRTNIVTEGEMIIIPANAPHSLKANVNFKMLLIMIKS
jgi:quercetin dioxygenase-like cupin family protein